MSSLFLESIAQHLVYNPDKTPFENIEQFFNATKAIQYEWAEEMVNGNSYYYLDGPWKDEIELQKITTQFYSQFVQHLVTISAAEEINYPDLLAKCKHCLQSPLYHFNIPYTSCLITLRPLPPNQNMSSIKYETLPDSTKDTLRRNYSAITVMFQQLAMAVEEEIRNYAFKEYIQTKSNYKWTGEKNKLSEIAMALVQSGYITKRDKKDIMPSVFARELAAYFNVEKFHFDQNIVAIRNKIHGSKTEGLDKLKEKLLYYFEATS